MLWGLSNLWTEGSEGAYSVRHGSRPVADLPPRRVLPSEEPSSNTCHTPGTTVNFFEKAFPCLFPFGCGGLESARVHHVDFGAHLRWALQYHN